MIEELRMYLIYPVIGCALAAYYHIDFVCKDKETKFLCGGTEPIIGTVWPIYAAWLVCRSIYRMFIRLFKWLGKES